MSVLLIHCVYNRVTICSSFVCHERFFITNFSGFGDAESAWYTDVIYIATRRDIILSTEFISVLAEIDELVCVQMIAGAYSHKVSRRDVKS